MPATVPNPEAELAFRYITETDEHVFLTGRAGTGKTTFLHRIRRECGKQLAVVAPTGVAAINARGRDHPLAIPIAVRDAHAR